MGSRDEFDIFAAKQAYPSRPVRIIIPFPAGQATDTIARLVGQSLSERLGQSFVIENRTGAGGNIGTEVVVRAPPDGYTLLLAGLPNAMNATLYKKLNYDFIRDIAPVASLGGGPHVMVVNPSVPAKRVPEFVAYAKANSGKINMGSSGNGAASHAQRRHRRQRFREDDDRRHAAGSLRTAERHRPHRRVPGLRRFRMAHRRAAHGVGWLPLARRHYLKPILYSASADCAVR